MSDSQAPLDVVDVALQLANYCDAHQHVYAFGGASSVCRASNSIGRG
jgi:hypothetical protein